MPCAAEKKASVEHFAHLCFPRLLARQLRVPRTRATPGIPITGASPGKFSGGTLFLFGHGGLEALIASWRIPCLPAIPSIESREFQPVLLALCRRVRASTGRSCHPNSCLGEGVGRQGREGPSAPGQAASWLQTSSHIQSPYATMSGRSTF